MKRTKHLLFLIAAVCLCLPGKAQNQDQEALKQLMRTRGEYYFTLSVDDPALINNLGTICSIDGTDGKNVVAYANQQEYEKLLALGFEPVLQTPPSLRANVTMWNGQGTYNWDSYLTYPQYVSMMEGFPAKALSDRTCEMFSLGTLSTSSHRQLLGVHIYKGSPNGKPRFLYSSTMHGDEITGMILMLRLIDELCTSTDSRILSLLDDVDIYILPLTNPDGTYKGGNSTVNSAQRYNGNNIDLNRNYKDYFCGDHPDNKVYQDETTWTMAFADSLLFTVGANYHGGAEVMNYCWDWVFQDHADMDWYEYVCTEYVALARQVSSSYMTGTYSDGVTNGATWYSITGSRQDYMNAYGQCREVTVECSTDKTPSASQLPTFWNYNHNSMLAFMEQCRNGVHGVVYDATTGQTLQGVTVSVLNHDISNSYVTTHEVGDFHRPIKGGSYTFVFDKEGYARKFVDVTVTDGQRVNLTVYLTPSSETAMECYEQVNAEDIVAGPYLMGYLNGSSFIMPSHNDRSTTNSVSVSTTSLSVTLTDNGFTLPHDIDRQKIAIEPSGTSGQYHIVYNGRMLQRSSNSLVWAKPSNSSGNGVTLSNYNWHVTANGIYMTSNSWYGSTNYYLYYDTSSNSFKLSTTNQNNNITFFTEVDCPATQQVALAAGWNWWAPTVQAEFADLTAALGTNYTIESQDGETVSEIILGQMYKIHVATGLNFTLSGARPASVTVTLNPNTTTWFGYTGTEATVSSVFNETFGPTEGDKVIDQDEGFAIFENGTWTGTLESLVPGKGHLYHSNAEQTRTITF